jgi:hypothetical protein
LINGVTFVFFASVFSADFSLVLFILFKTIL